MKTKILSFLCASVLMLVLFISLASATITITNIPTLSQTGNSANITIQSNQNETISFSGLSDITYKGKTITFTLPPDKPLTAGVPEIITINYNVPSGFEFELGEDYSTVLTLTGTNSSTINQTLFFEESDYCEYDNPDSNIEIKIRDIQVTTGFAEEDNEWYPLDEVEIEVRVDNKGNDDIKNIEVSWCLYDTNNKECVMDEEEKDFDLKDGKDKTITISFQIDPDDIDPDVEDYIFYVGATGEDQETDKNICDSDSDSVKIIIEDDFVVLSDIKATPETVQCGGELQITADVWNIGEDEQENVYVEIYNEDGVKEESVDIGDIDSFESKKLTFTLKIPGDAQEGTHKIELSVYDEDDDIYETDGGEESKSIVQVKVEGNCGVVEPKVLVSAVLESGGKAGQELVVRATVTNTGTKTTNYALGASNYDSWAELVSIEPSVIILNAGESKNILYTLKVNSDVSGEKMFNIEATTDGETVKQPVSVIIEQAGIGGGFGRITGGVIGQGNWYLWAIGALNVILVIIIVIVAIRVARS